MTNKEFAKMVYDAAKGLDIHPLFVTAQACLETGWGKKTIGKYNIFGITKGSWEGRTILVQTTEIHSTAKKHYVKPEEVVKIVALPSGRYRYIVHRLFRDYDSLEQCLDDYCEIFRKPHFSHAWAYRNDPEKFARAIQQGKMKYATDPNYSEVLISVMKTVKRLLNE